MSRTPCRKKPLLQYILICCLVLLLLAAPSLSAQNGNADLMRSPFSPQKRPGKRDVYETSTPKLIAKGAILFYSKLISPADGPRSPSYPTGSAYGLRAVNRYGFLTGVILTADRLIHESDLPLGPVINVYGTRRFYDPIQHNTFWWDESVQQE